MVKKFFTLLLCIALLFLGCASGMQQKAVERIHELMAQGISSGQAIALVAEELRATHTGEQIVARFEDEDEDE